MGLLQFNAMLIKHRPELFPPRPSDLHKSSTDFFLRSEMLSSFTSLTLSCNVLESDSSINPPHLIVSPFSDDSRTM